MSTPPANAAAAILCVGDIAWDAAAIRSHAEQFGEERFLDGLRAEIARLMDGRGR